MEKEEKVRLGATLIGGLVVGVLIGVAIGGSSLTGFAF